MKSANYNFILIQFMLGAIIETQLTILVANKYISDVERLEIIAVKNGVA